NDCEKQSVVKRRRGSELSIRSVAPGAVLGVESVEVHDLARAERPRRRIALVASADSKDKRSAIGDDPSQVGFSVNGSSWARRLTLTHSGRDHPNPKNRAVGDWGRDEPGPIDRGV